MRTKFLITVIIFLSVNILFAQDYQLEKVVPIGVFAGKVCFDDNDQCFIVDERSNRILFYDDDFKQVRRKTLFKFGSERIRLYGKMSDFLRHAGMLFYSPLNSAFYVTDSELEGIREKAPIRLLDLPRNIFFVDYAYVFCYYPNTKKITYLTDFPDKPREEFFIKLKKSEEFIGKTEDYQLIIFDRNDSTVKLFNTAKTVEEQFKHVNHIVPRKLMIEDKLVASLPASGNYIHVGKKHVNLDAEVEVDWKKIQFGFDLNRWEDFTIHQKKIYILNNKGKLHILAPN